MKARYASDPARSRGRRHDEPPPSHRSEYQRDRDRIVHSAAFRRLEYKTQVFVNHEGDMFRTRLTHSIEVAQIGRTVARALGLDEDLTEAIALAHDLGHTPFGHAGQDALDACMEPYGGFEHNVQSLRVVDALEEKYAAFDGLNLTFETREGILKHCARERARALGDVGERFIAGTYPSAEAQLANLADEIAYNNHDVDDGLRAGMFGTGDLQETALFRGQYEEVRRLYGDLPQRRVIHETVRRMIDRQVGDLVKTSTGVLDRVAPGDADAVRGAGEPCIRFSDTMRGQALELKRFLRAGMYQHPRVREMSAHARGVVRILFDAYFGDARLLPGESAHLALERERVRGVAGRARVVADYIAGMTDRFALAEHERLDVAL